MLRFAVLALLLANIGYYAWSDGRLRGLGLGPAVQTEPERLEQQIHPENLRILRAAPSEVIPAPPAAAASAPGSVPPQGSPAASVSSTTAAPPDPAVCLQAGVFDPRQAEALRAAAGAILPPSTWSLDSTPIAGRWMVYMGRFADEDAMDRKRAELRARKVPYDHPGAALEPGLSLGRYSTEEAAERALNILAGQGVRTARVVRERIDATGYVLRIPAATGALRAQLDTLRPALDGKALRACG